ncbi:MAG TPA: hypothetical protein PLU95_03365, partial [Syntrophales bacterium]|nr:hypothetical protein [Syntrophales bacterium]
TGRPRGVRTTSVNLPIHFIKAITGQQYKIYSISGALCPDTVPGGRGFTAVPEKQTKLTGTGGALKEA